MNITIDKKILNIYQFEKALITALERWKVIPCTFEEFSRLSLPLAHESVTALMNTKWDPETGLPVSFVFEQNQCTVEPVGSGVSITRKMKEDSRVKHVDYLNEYGLLIRTDVCVDDNAPQTIFSATYDEDRITSQVVTTCKLVEVGTAKEPKHMAEVVGVQKTTYQYDSLNRMILSESEDGTVTDAFEYASDDDLQPINIVTLTKDDEGNVVGNLSMEMHYDEHKNLHAMKEYVNGDLVHEIDLDLEYVDDRLYSMIQSGEIIMALGAYWNKA